MENDEQIAEGEQQEETTESSESKQGTDYRAKLNAQNRFLEKEGYTFENGKWVKPVIKEEATKKEETKVANNDSNLSPKDLYALNRANVDLEDIDEVEKAAKILGKSIPEALEDDMVKSLLQRRGEERKTAEASNVRGGKPSTKKASPQEILKRAESGNIPEAGTPEAEELFWARRGGRRE